VDYSGGCFLSYYERPTAASVISLIGGILSFFGSLLLIGIVGPFLMFPGASLFFLLGGWTMICAIVIIIGAVMIYQQPEQHSQWGIIVLIFSIIGGINILGIIGGALGIAWNLHGVSSYAYGYSSQTLTRICPACKLPLTQDSRFCPHCGTRIW